MAALWWHSEVRTLSEALGGIGELKQVIAAALPQHGFSNIQRNTLEVAGGKNACWVSIAHFHIADRRFWEVVMCSADGSAVAHATVDEVVAMLHNFRFL